MVWPTLGPRTAEEQNRTSIHQLYFRQINNKTAVKELNTAHCLTNAVQSTDVNRAYSKEFFGVHNFKSSCMTS